MYVSFLINKKLCGVKNMVCFFQSMFPNSALSKKSMGNNSFTLALELIHLCLLWAPLPTDFLSFKATNNLTGKLAGALVHCQMVTRFEIGSCVRTADVPWHSNLKT